MLNKRSVSPLIATILLIVVSVILITVVLTWAKGFTQNTTDKATDLLDQSKDISKTGVFWQTSLLGDQLILKNQIIDDIEIKGYKILSTDYNSDYFWLNSYRSFENNITFSPSTLTPITLVCVPTNKFYLELIDINDQSYTLEINPINNRSFTSCNTFNVPLWEFETISGSYIINTFNKQPGELITNGDFDIDSDWTKGPGWSISNGFANSVSNAVSDFSQGVILFKSKVYKIEFVVSDISQGTIEFYALNSFPSVIPRSQIGKFVEYKYMINNASRIYLTARNFTGLIDSISIQEIDPLPTFKDGTKYLECISDGVITIPSSQAYGTWEFDIYRNSTGFPYVFFINDKTNSEYPYHGYDLVFNSQDRIYFRANTGHLFYTKLNYFISNNWYGIKIIRSKSGLFEIYIKGGSFGRDNWTLISTNSGYGNNPITHNTYNTSNYFMVYLNSGDRITNIKLTPVVDQ